MADLLVLTDNNNTKKDCLPFVSFLVRKTLFVTDISPAGNRKSYPILASCAVTSEIR